MKKEIIILLLLVLINMVNANYINNVSASTYSDFTIMYSYANVSDISTYLQQDIFLNDSVNLNVNYSMYLNDSVIFSDTYSGNNTYLLHSDMLYTNISYCLSNYTAYCEISFYLAEELYQEIINISMILCSTTSSTSSTSSTSTSTSSTSTSVSTTNPGTSSTAITTTTVPVSTTLEYGGLMGSGYALQDFNSERSASDRLAESTGLEFGIFIVSLFPLIFILYMTYAIRKGG